MKSKYLIILWIFLAVNIIKAQQTVQHIPVFDEEKAQNSIFTKGDYYLESINCVDEEKNDQVEEIINKVFAYSEEKLSVDNANWVFDKWVKSLAFKGEAKSFLNVDYSYSRGSKVTEVRQKEKSGNPRLPYFVVTKVNFVELEVVLTLDYADGSPTVYDTIYYEKQSKIIPGKKYYTIEALDEYAMMNLSNALNGQLDFVKSKEVQFVFPKVKIKDKELKAAYKQVKDLLKDGQLKEAGKIAKQVYEAEKKPEQAQALGLCYELVGNYPKAAEMFKIQSDFHINVRMKKDMRMLEFAESIGYKPDFVEFD